MRILFLLQEFPYPPDNGVRWKPYTLLKGLSSRQECHILCFSGEFSRAAREGFLRECPGVKILGIFRPRNRSALSWLSGLLHAGLPSAGVYRNREFEHALRSALSETNYDVIHVDMINLVQYARFLAGHPVLLSVNDAVSLGYSNGARTSPALAAKARMAAAARVIRNYERRAYKNMVVHVVSGVDQAYLRHICPTARVELVELPVDPSYLDASTSSGAEGPRIVTFPLARNLASRDLALAVVSGLRSALAQRGLEASIEIIGAGADPSFLRQLQPLNGVRYLGWVEDYRAALAKASVIVIPDRAGSGTKNRALQAMALGKPVVTTPLVAAGVGAEHNRHCLICGSADEFVASITALLSDNPLANSLASEARSLIHRRHHPECVALKWEALYARLSARAADAGGNERPLSQRGIAATRHVL